MHGINYSGYFSDSGAGVGPQAGHLNLGVRHVGFQTQESQAGILIEVDWNWEREAVAKKALCSSSSFCVRFGQNNYLTYSPWVEFIRPSCERCPCCVTEGNEKWQKCQEPELTGLAKSPSLLLLDKILCVNHPSLFI